jgi:hypothetical protein
MDQTCHKCGKSISRRAKSYVWNGQLVVCTSCLQVLEGERRRGQAAIGIAGKAGAPWLVYDGSKQWGPYPTEQLKELLAAGRVDRMWNVWREGMGKWTPAGRLFTIPELSRGKIELRDFGQGDGTYRPEL